MHEHPATATSWKILEMLELIAAPGIEITTVDMCAFGMKSEDTLGESLVRKSTKILSNSEEIIKSISRRCDGSHRHIQMIGGKAKNAQIYPRAFCQAVCEGIASQKRIGELG